MRRPPPDQGASGYLIVMMPAQPQPALAFAVSQSFLREDLATDSHPSIASSPPILFPSSFSLLPLLSRSCLAPPSQLLAISSSCSLSLSSASTLTCVNSWRFGYRMSPRSTAASPPSEIPTCSRVEGGNRTAAPVRPRLACSFVRLLPSPTCIAGTVDG